MALLKKFWGIILIILILFTFGCKLDPESVEVDEYVLLEVNGIGVSAKVADDDLERMRGLMYVKELCDDCGMIFMFENSSIKNFWMKSTLIPLDMLFIAENGTIIKIHEAEPCKEDPCETYSSEKPVKYVLELNKGFSKQNNVSEGDFVDI